MTGLAPRSTHAILERAARGEAALDGAPRGGVTPHRSPRGHQTTRVITLDRHFQGLPDTAHGGTVLALFDAVRPATGPRTLHGIYRRRVPLATQLSLAIDHDGSTTRFALSDGATLLVDGVVATGRAGAPPAAAGDDGVEGVPVPAEAMPLPLSKTCFACGVENPLGLHAQLTIDDRTVGGRWTPHAGFRAPDGTVAPVAVTTLLDEAAFWLGAAASGEAGMTTDLRVQLDGALPVDGGLVVAGRRAGVRAHANDARYWDTEIGAWDEAGRPVASARITFVAVRGAARKLVTGLLAMNPPQVLRRIFPAYVP